MCDSKERIFLKSTVILFSVNLEQGGKQELET